MSEKEIIQGCIKGDRKHQRALYDQFVGVMYAICLRYSGDRSYAEDILQEGFTKVFSNITAFKSEGSFEGWMKRIFIHTAINYYHKTRHLKELIDISDELPDHVQEQVDAISKLTEKELLTLVGSLPTGYRLVFNLYAIEGYDHDEISQLLNIAAGTSRSQLVKARRMLQKKLKEMKIFAA